MRANLILALILGMLIHPVFPQNTEVSDADFAEWMKEADQGDALAQYNIGVVYGKGLGVPLDYKEAIRWYRAAAEQGHAFAQNNLGSMYDEGKGVPQDYKEAVRWNRASAEQGNVIAKFNLGNSYSAGRRNTSGLPGSHPLVSCSGRAGTCVCPEQPWFQL